jgi:hypothetical protein
MSEHIATCTTEPEATEFSESQTEVHMGPERCPACDEYMDAQHAAEDYAEFGMSWVHGGGDPADVAAAYRQDKALIAEREQEQREREEANARERAAVTRPKDRPVKGWRNQHTMTGEPFKGKWEYEAGCDCAKCFNHDLFIQDCLGEWEYVE